MALKPEMCLAGTELWKTDIKAAKQRRDSAISWLVDLVKIFSESESEAANGKKPNHPPTRRYATIW